VTPVLRQDFAQCGQQAVEAAPLLPAVQALSGLRPRKSGISDLPGIAVSAISLVVRAAIDIVEAVRAGRQLV
jgi:hypothetical protein